MRKILFVSHSGELNGAERMLLQTLKKLDRKKFEPALVVPAPGLLEEEARRLGVEVARLPLKWWLTEKNSLWKQPLAWLWNLKSISAIARMIRQRNIDLVFSNSSAAWNGAWAARRERIPHIWAVHELLGGESPFLVYLLGRQALARNLLRLSCRVIANSSATAEFFPDRSRVRVVPNGVEIPGKSEEKTESLRKELGIEEGDIVLGIVGKIFKLKGQRELLLSLPSPRQSFPRLKLLVVGGVGDLRYFRSLKAIIAHHQLHHTVIFTGYRKDLVEVFPLLSLLVLASRQESFGRVAVEAMAAGVPVLAARGGAIPEIIADGENGFLVDSNRPEVLGAAIERILRDPSQMQKIARAGYESVRVRYQLEDQVRKIEEVILECLA
jgi:glycosyltransferase involved in cell wall biosynthesis